MKRRKGIREKRSGVIKEAPDFDVITMGGKKALRNLKDSYQRLLVLESDMNRYNPRNGQPVSLNAYRLWRNTTAEIVNRVKVVLEKTIGLEESTDKVQEG